ncbi:hypothetical protein ACUOCP_56920, partial [Escherichia sp. R-CC3]
IENSALKKGAEVVRDALEVESPVSAHPKPPSPKESWRTGKYAMPLQRHFASHELPLLPCELLSSQ